MIIVLGEQKKGAAVKLEWFAVTTIPGKKRIQLRKIQIKEKPGEDDQVMLANEKTGMVSKLVLLVETVAKKKTKEKFDEENEVVSMGVKKAVAEGLESYVVSVRLEGKHLIGDKFVDVYGDSDVVGGIAEKIRCRKILGPHGGGATPGEENSRGNADFGQVRRV